MRTELETYHRIDRYIRGKMSIEEVRAFEAQLASDSQLADELAWQKTLNNLVEEVGFQGLKAKMAEDIRQLDRAALRKKWYFGAGLFVGLLMLGSFFFWLANSSGDTKPQSPRSVRQSSVSPMVKDAPLAINETKKKEGGLTATNGMQPTSKAQLVIAPVEELPIVELKSVMTETQPGASPTQEMVPTKKEVVMLGDPEKGVSPCDGVVIEIVPTVSKACAGEENGKILFEEGRVKGGRGPYLYGLQQKVPLSSKPFFYGLAAGHYVAVIKDQVGCEQLLPVEVGTKKCALSYSFQPDQGEVLEFPIEHSRSYSIFILNKQGVGVYTYRSSEGTAPVWNGADQHGKPLEAGLYIYLIEYANGEKEKGQITLLR